MRPIPLPHTVDALLLSDQVNIFYVTGFRGLSPTEREAYALVLPNEVHLFTNALYKEEAETLSSREKKLHTHITSHDNPFKKLLKETIDSHAVKKLGFEASSLSVSEYEDVKRHLSATECISTGGVVENIRMKKTKEEIEIISQTAALTDACFAFVSKVIKPGITEQHVAWEIEKFFCERGATSAFASIVAGSTASTLPHYASQNKKITGESSVLLDFGAKIDGYHADLTRVLYLGNPPQEWKKVYQTVKKAQGEALSYLSSTKNPSGARADEVARKVITDAGFPPYPHSLGHSVGLSIHESPRLSIHKEVTIVPGMVFTLEPGIYLPGKFGIRIEDLFVMTGKGPQKLSHAPYFIL